MSKSPLDHIEDVLMRCDRVLRDAILLELSPASWNVLSPMDEEYFKQTIPDKGPVWNGLPGTHPLLPIIRRAIRDVEQLRSHSDS